MRERLFYLDFVRAIAVILILLTHFNAWFVFGVDVPQYDKCVITEFPFGIYIGDLGVSMFLIISGAALMYVYEEKLELVKFYKKRFLAIYPMFWMAYIVAVLPALGVWKSFGFDIPKWRILLTVTGMDGYFSEYGSGFYVLGEWFLGFIVIFYVIFPLLKVCLKKNEVITWIAIIILYCITVYFYDLEMSMSKCILIRLPELCFGMTLVKHRFRIKFPIALFALAVLCANAIVRPDFNSSIQTTYVGIAFFVLLVFLSYYTEYSPVKKVCAFLSKYSYAIFLVHHVAIQYIQSAFDLESVTVVKSYIIFFVCVAVIIPISIMLQTAEKGIMAKILPCKKQ